MLQRPLIYHRTMNPGGQAAAAISLKDVLFIDGANQSGKSYLLSYLIASYMIPHPNDPEFSYWPCVPDFTSETPWENLTTQLLRQQRKFKLPTQNWLITPTMELHREMAMVHLPPLLDPFLDHRRTEWSKENKGIWDTVYVMEKYGSSRLSLKSWTQWLNNRHVFTTAVLDTVSIDEPCPEGMFGESLMRTATKKGRVVISATLVDNDHEGSLSHEAEWMENKFIYPSEQGTLPEIVDVINIPLDENPYVHLDVFEERLDLLDETERNIRRYGRRLTRRGLPYFDERKIEALIQRVEDPIAEGYLLGDTLIPDIPDGSPDFWYRVWQEPDETCPGYLVACDPADGGDCPVDIQVWRTHPLGLVCNANGPMTEDEIPGELIKLCYWYNGTRLLDGTDWDGNPQPGLARLARIFLGLDVHRAKLVLNAMMRGYAELGVNPPLPRLYYRPTETSLARDKHFPSQDPGWESTSVTRPYLLTYAKQVVNQAYQAENVMIPDINTLTELYRFVSHKRGQRNDRVMNVGMIGLMTKQNPFRVDIKDKRSRPLSGFAIPLGLERMSVIPPQLQQSILQEPRYG